MGVWRWVALVGMTLAVPAVASTYFTVEKKCPVGGQKFKYAELGSISTWGAMPDGMPLGSGIFPIAPPQCPGNGLVMFREFDKAAVAKLKPFVEGEEYRALRTARETVYYLSWRTARMLGDADPEWLLLSATWEAKNDGAGGERANRYNAEFVAVVQARPVDAASFESIALRARAANALRELGRFDEAEALRAGIVIAQDAGGTDEGAAKNREGWANYLKALAGPVARGDRSRSPIDMASDNDASFRCMGKEFAEKYKDDPPPPLTAFEVEYCARPELADELAQRRKTLAE